MDGNNAEKQYKLENMSIAICSGTFDPITLGHCDVIARASQIFSRVIVAVAQNASKNTWFDLETRCELARVALKDFSHVEVKPVKGLLVDFAKEQQAQVILKGIRNLQDYTYEDAMSMVNRKIAGIETLFLPTDPQLAHISSSMVKELTLHGADITEFVPANVAQAISQLRAES